MFGIPISSLLKTFHLFYVSDRSHPPRNKMYTFNFYNKMYIFSLLLYLYSGLYTRYFSTTFVLRISSLVLF